MSSYFTDVLLTKDFLFLWLSDVQVFAILCTCVLAALQDILSENPDKKLQNVDVLFIVEVSNAKKKNLTFC